MFVAALLDVLMGSNDDCIESGMLRIAHAKKYHGYPMLEVLRSLAQTDLTPNSKSSSDASNQVSVIYNKRLGSKQRALLLSRMADIEWSLEQGAQESPQAAGLVAAFWQAMHSN